MLTLLAACISLKPTEVRAEESLLEAWERQNQAATGENHNNVPQLKEEDILRMNQGNADFLYNDEGYVTFLRGRFYEDKVTDTEKGVESLMGIAELLGLSRGSEFFAVYGEQDEYGYTYLTYKQRYGDLTLENAVLKIILDPQGYTAGTCKLLYPKCGNGPGGRKLYYS